MRHLSELQADFQAYLLSDAQGASFINAIVNDAKVGATKRLSIYADAYHLRIIEALATAYPKLHSLLGDDFFDSTARSYIKCYPSTYRNMRWVGGEMAAYLQATLPQHPIGSEMAQFEWALGIAFDAEDASIVNLSDLAKIPAEDWAALTFILHPSAHLLPLQWNVVQIWNALNIEETPPTAVQTKAPCLVWRKDLNAHFRSLDAAEYAGLQSIIAGASFGALCEILQDNASEADASMQAAQYLSGWLHEGLISKTA
ncbi:MAG: putative DNA-binding domain-containing protein [Bdellovibrio sp.]|nr:putative DNA-binding domain-containing protein [Methylotenera sp.]